MASNTVPTPIVDKNGKPTTVHKKVDGGNTASKSRVASVPTKPPVKPSREPLINTKRIYDQPENVPHEWDDDWDEDFVDPPHNDIILPGHHPLYGEGGWGVSYSESWDDWQVNHGAIGSFHRMDGDDLYVGDSKVPLQKTDVLWYADTKRGEEAAILWQYRNEINAELIKKGYGGSKSVRLRAEISDTDITISQFDRKTWDSITIPRD